MKHLFSWRHAILQSDLAATTRHVLLTISCHMSDAGDSCFPSTRTLAAETGLSERAVITHIHRARDAGWLKIGAHGFGGQRWRAHEYVVDIPDGYGQTTQRTEPRSAAWPKGTEPHAEGTEPGSARGTEPCSAAWPKGTEPHAEGTEPHDEKALNEVQSNATDNSTGNATAAAARARAPARSPARASQARQSDAKPKLAVADLRDDYDLPADLAAQFLAIRRDKKLTLTPKAMGDLGREFDKAGLALADGIELCCRKSWGGFRASWAWQDDGAADNGQGNPGFDTDTRAGASMARLVGIAGGRD